jgi:preprotein translocase subunit SecF
LPLRLIPDGTRLPFMKWARIRTPISLVLIVVSFILFFTVGVNVGIDFVGGTELEIQSQNGPADIGAVRSAVEGLGLGDVQIQGIGDDRGVLIRIALQPGGDEAQVAAVDEVRAAVEAQDYTFRQ